MKKVKVEFNGGESRMNPGQAVDYMLASIDDIELYAEQPAEDGWENFDTLEREIRIQAIEAGIDDSCLCFE